MIRRIVLLGLTAASLLVATACGGPTTGQPMPAPGGAATDPSPSSNSGSSSISNSAGSSLESRDPCSLLSQHEVAGLGISGQPQRKKIGSADTCQLQPANGSLGIGIRTNVGLAGMQPNGGQITDTKVGNHLAKQLVDTTGSCTIAIGVTSSARVDVITHYSDNDTCPFAVQVAQLVEPKLP
ncbi:DUF3558 domain-containing protein [Solihabitans fulvus]|uniref:DUF3558 domain-containing protein n=1 Tax=Solihabitans fulvus TaxID=1892852 RepID=A0A5B2XMG4_9PSEU|nr:DUF3558 family protein [Solihabitans fulvus]KAA2264576.1 DUF3558 domain-containing protein [Solihabitans fulvus]